MGRTTDILEDSVEVTESTLDELASEIEEAADAIVDALEQGNKVLICGNGGSAAQAQHFSGELLHRFEEKRQALPALALNAEQSGLTAAANDDGYETTFARHLEALGEEGDVIVGLTTSGNSENVVKALRLGKEMGLTTMCLNGKTGGEVKKMGIDHNMIVPSHSTARVQEIHLKIIHILCRLVDDAFMDTEAETS